MEFCLRGEGRGGLVRVPEMLVTQRSQGSLRLLLLTIAVVILVNVAPATFQALYHTLDVDHFLNIPNCPIILYYSWGSGGIL